MTTPNPRRPYTGARHQRGVATLLVALMVLIILTIIVLSSSNVALFEQKTTINENRQHLADQAAEYALNLGGEFLKANVENISQNEDDNGWLKSDGTAYHWIPCPAEPADQTNHPCMAESDSGRRSQLYYYTTDGAAHDDADVSGVTQLNLPLTQIPTAVQQTSVGGTGTAAFPVTSKVRALLCRLDTTAGSLPTCQLSPTTGNRIAVTIIASSNLTDESAKAEIKETWGTYSSFSAQASVPLVSSGIVKGLGNASIVAAPNAGGYGLPGSIWSPNNADVDGSAGGGVGSVTTCHLGDYLGNVPVSELETTCAGSGNTGCGCSNVASGSPDMLSGHFGGSYKQESIDVLDVDSNHGSPDVQFFPGKTSTGTRMDHQAVSGACKTTEPYCMTDDNLFEWIFGVDVTSSDLNTPTDEDGYPLLSGGEYHPSAAIAANEITRLTGADGLGAQTGVPCSSLNSDSSGLYYVGTGCSFGGTDVGSPDNPVVVVADGDVTVTGNFNFFGLLFVRDPSTGASFTGHGTVNIFGSVVAEGDVDINGGLNIIYVDTSTGTPGKKLSPTTRFARLPGSWLDSMKGF